MDDLSARSEQIGIKINTEKTQGLVIRLSNGCITSAAMTAADGTTITSQETLKLFGYHFDTGAGVAVHVEKLRLKFRRKIWMIYHLRLAGVQDDNLFKLYCCYVRAVLE